MAPVTTKAERQPKVSVTAATSGGASSAPSEVPTLKKPTAIDFSLSGNHSATAFMPAGIAAASVSPIRPRAPASETQPVTPPCRQPAIDHNAANSAKPSRKPMASTISPQTGCMIV